MSRASRPSLTHLASSPGWEAGQTDPLLQVSLAVQFEESDVIVQGLAVVVVVDVGGGHPQSLGPRAPVLLSQIVVTNTNIDGVTSPDDAEKREIRFVLHFMSHILSPGSREFVSDFLTFQGCNEMECKTPTITQCRVYLFMVP